MKSFTVYMAICLVGSGACASIGHAAPQIGVVTGKFDHGEQVTIGGAGFGSRGNYNNVNATWKGHRFMAFRVKDFDDKSLSSGGFNNPNSSWTLRQGGRHGSGFYATKFYNGQRLGALEANQQGTTGTWYVSFWFMMPANAESGKFFRVYGSGNAGNIYLSSGGPGSGRTVRGYSECTAPECSTATVWSSADSFGPSQWRRVEILMRQGNNGSFSTYVDGKHQWTRERWVATTPGIYNGHTIDLGNMIDEGSTSPDSHSYNFDDAYIDFTQARVEIGNSPTWANSSHREVQVPLAWSADSISVAINSGSFAAGSQAYLYVVDSSGNVNSNGFPITIGAVTEEASPPVPPEVQVE